MAKQAVEGFSRVQLHPETPRVLMTPRQVIHDAEFNLGRSIEPVHPDGTPHSLRGTVGPDTPLGGVGNEPYIRFSTEKEQTRWLTLHDKEEWFQQLAADKQAAPAHIVADGFGRFDGVVDQYGLDHPIWCKLLNTADPLAGLVVSLLLNNQVRKQHPLDLARTIYDMKKAWGCTYKTLADYFGFSQGYISQVMKCYKLTETHLNQAIRDHWPLSRIIKVVDSYQPDGGSPEVTPATCRVPLKTIDRLIDYAIDPILKGKVEGVKLSDKDENDLTLIQIVMEWLAGRYEVKSDKKAKVVELLQVAQGQGYLTGFDLQKSSLEQFAKDREKGIKPSKAKTKKKAKAKTKKGKKAKKAAGK